MTPIQERIVKMQDMADSLVALTANLVVANAKALGEGKDLTGETYDLVKAAIDACHDMSLKYYGLSIITHSEQSRKFPQRPGAEEGGGGGPVEPPYPKP